MATPTQQTEVRAVYGACRLGKSELNRLFSLAPEGIPAVSVAISTQRDSTRYSAGTLTGLIEHIRDANASGNLDSWDNLNLEAADNTGDRKITIKIDTGRVEVQVAGGDATWVHGQAARIDLLLKGAGGRNHAAEADRAAAASKDALTASIAVILLAGGLLLGWKVTDVGHARGMELFADMAMGTLIGAGPVALAGLLAFFFARRTNRARLTPTAEVPHGHWWHRASTTDKIALCALTVAILTFLATLTMNIINTEEHIAVPEKQAQQAR
ncbi:hypothetical protein J0X20_03235 [Streptomyces sp. KCTC 0041BP]|uniref:hypothetical protein n=1 Tax=Streptomyces sp. KCTC 0041BP TaxID=201500 RepID=UPI001AE5837F|nr:hypothetical protein [Streptomyces sp. KCTC 0041BP]MBP0932630.1 hypothetical protein [Streptomyces sp. KCTC 0041BP]